MGWKSQINPYIRVKLLLTRHDSLMIFVFSCFFLVYIDVRRLGPMVSGTSCYPTESKVMGVEY